METRKIVEAILFASSRPVAIDEIIKSSGKSIEEVKKAIEELKKFYEDSSIEIAVINGRYAMQIKNEYAEYAREFAPVELSKNHIKTLALIAYHQPIKQSELKKMIGSSVYDYVRLLAEKGFINAKKEGRTKIIEVSQHFYDYFGIDRKDRDAIKKMLEQSSKKL
ncbi:MAG: SMC-Scp complex subunit ScpB [Thermoplasmata archaeon]|nr:SMC-Scp complex subunit ScpB [Thermoplasmata archaeon]